MKKSIKITVVTLTILLFVSIASVSVFAMNKADKKVNIRTIQEDTKGEQEISKAIRIKIDNNKVFNALLLKSSDMESFDNVEYYDSDIRYEAIFKDGAIVSFDKDLNILAYSGFKRNTKISNTNIIEILKQEYSIDETYHLNINYETNETDKEDVVYYWVKAEENGISNIYDALSVRIDGRTNQMIVFNRFNNTAEPSEIRISEAEAKRIALSLKEEFHNVTSCKKAYVKPNDFWNEEEYTDERVDTVRLVYQVLLNENKYSVYVDAETGDVLGGDMIK